MELYWMLGWLIIGFVGSVYFTRENEDVTIENLLFCCFFAFGGPVIVFLMALDSRSFGKKVLHKVLLKKK